MRIYQAVPENLPVFHQFFNEYLLPVQLKHGARLVGRWETEDSRIVAIWEYDSLVSYEEIQAAVRDDPASHAAQAYRQTLPQLFTEFEEVFMTSTVQPRLE
jgi:hypothetical protein